MVLILYQHMYIPVTLIMTVERICLQVKVLEYPIMSHSIRRIKRFRMVFRVQNSAVTSATTLSLQKDTDAYADSRWVRCMNMKSAQNVILKFSTVR